MPRWFSDIWVPELLLPPKIIRMFGPKMAIFAQKIYFLWHIYALLVCGVPLLVGYLVVLASGLYLARHHLLYGIFCL